MQNAGFSRFTQYKRLIKGILLGIIIVAILVAPVNTRAYAESASFKEESIQFQSGDVTLSGTLLVPEESGKHPAIVLVHGAGVGKRGENRPQAEMFAKAGIAALIYDKREKGYSASGIGGRSYSLLADDVLAAVGTLRTRPDIDPTKIGLWGFSEGAWVAPLAASHSSQIDFLITVGASGVPPIQQQSWSIENRLRQQGVSSKPMIQSITRRGQRMLVAANLFPEALYNPIPALEQLKLPILAIWGDKDRQVPPVESSRIMQDTLNRIGDHHYTIQIIPNASHNIHATNDGFTKLNTFAPEYSEVMTSWVLRVTQDELPGPVILGETKQDRLSPEGITRLAWFDSELLQFGAMLILTILFAAYLVMSAIFRTKYRNRQTINRPLHKTSILLSTTGLLTVLGFFGYFGFIMITGATNTSPIVAGRPLAWLIIQILTLATSLFIVLFLTSSRIQRSSFNRAERFRLAYILMVSIVFIPWAAYWNLLIP